LRPMNAPSPAIKKPVRACANPPGGLLRIGPHNSTGPLPRVRPSPPVMGLVTGAAEREVQVGSPEQGVSWPSDRHGVVDEGGGGDPAVSAALAGGRVRRLACPTAGVL